MRALAFGRQPIPLSCAVTSLLLVLAGSAGAERDHAVGVYFDPGATARAHRVLPLQAFDLFVITFNLDLPTGKRAEVLGGFEVAVQLDPRLVVIDREALPYTSAEVTDRDGVIDDNWVVESSQCLPGERTVRLIRYVTLLAVAADDVVVCLDAPSAGSLQPASPAWIDCSGSAHPLAYVRELGPTLPRGCGVVNPRLTVSTEAAAWSTLKRRFR